MSDSLRILGIWITDPAEFARRQSLGARPKPEAFIFSRGGLAFRFTVLNPTNGAMAADGPVDLHLSTYAYENDDYYMSLYSVLEPPDSEPLVVPWCLDPDGSLLIFEKGDWSHFVAETSVGASEHLGVPLSAFRETRAEIEGIGHGWVDKGVIENTET